MIFTKCSTAVDYLIANYLFKLFLLLKVVQQLTGLFYQRLLLNDELFVYVIYVTKYSTTVY